MRAMTVGRWLALGCALIGLSGCLYSTDVTVSGVDVPEFTVAKDWHVGRQPCFESMTVYRQNSDGEVPVWSLSTTGARCIVVKTFRYGTVPAGFHVFKPAQALKTGVPYVMYGSGDRWLVQAKFKRTQSGIVPLDDTAGH